MSFVCEETFAFLFCKHSSIPAGFGICIVLITFLMSKKETYVSWDKNRQWEEVYADYK